MSKYSAEELDVIKQSLEFITIDGKDAPFISALIQKISNDLEKQKTLKNSNYESWYDLDTRKDISEKVDEYISSKNRKNYNIAVFGSPGCQELKDISDETKAKINITAFDIKPIITEESSKYKSFVYNENDIFGFDFEKEFENKFDIVVNRWFLHHCTTSQKNKVFEISKNILRNNGKLITVDYFIPSWKTLEERINAVRLYTSYHTKFAKKMPHVESMINLSKKIDHSDFKGGKMDSINHVGQMVLDAGLHKIEVGTICSNPNIDNPDLWGQYIIVASKK